MEILNQAAVVTPRSDRGAVTPPPPRFAEPRIVPETPDVFPLSVDCCGDHVRFCFASASDIFPALPTDYEDVLESELRNLLDEGVSYTVEVDLQNVPAVSSRQLGSLIALQKVLRKRFGRIPITNVTETVRHLLVMTRTDQLFDLP
jgi:ABC-type transporter Mla MlaB component